MNIRILEVRHLGNVFGSPIFLSAGDIEEVKTCPACTDGQDQHLIAVAEGKEARGIALARCGACSHVYLSRRPSKDWYQRYYADEWDTGRLTKSDQSPTARIRSFLHRTLRGIEPARRLYKAARTLVASETPEPTTSFQREAVLSMLVGLGSARDMRALPIGSHILEIGSGYGGALAIFKSAGFSAIGTEASTHRARFCESQGYHIVQTPIDNLDAVKAFGPFDFVYSAHVVEHLLDPARLLAEVAPLLKDGGYVYFEVPNAGIAEHIVKLLHYPVHCNAFSPSSMTHMLARQGFRPVRMLVDANLHAIARKEPTGSDFAVSGTGVEAKDLLRGNGEWLRHQGQIRIFFDDFDMRITGEPGGDVLYELSNPYSNRAATESSRPNYGREYWAEVQPGAEKWPVRCIHDTPKAPMWMKFQ